VVHCLLTRVQEEICSSCVHLLVRFIWQQINTHHYRKHVTKTTSKLGNLIYIPQLTDKTAKEYKVDKYIALYSLMSRNILPPLALAMCPYIPRLIEEYTNICSSVNRGIY
jgi:hypothetical protein